MLSPKRATDSRWSSCQPHAARDQAPIRVARPTDRSSARRPSCAEPHAGLDEPELAVAVRGLVEVHEVHVDLRPRQLAVELRVQVQERLAEQRTARRSTSSPARTCASRRRARRMRRRRSRRGTADGSDSCETTTPRLDHAYGYFRAASSAPATSRLCSATVCDRIGAVQLLCADRRTRARGLRAVSRSRLT